MGQGEDPERSDKPHDDRSQDLADSGLADVRNRLDALEGKLDARRPTQVDEQAAKNERSQFTIAAKVSSDFIAAIFVGGALGWFLDSFAGTSPFGLIILLLLGFAAGVLNVMRTLGLVAEAPSVRARQKWADEARRHDTEENERDGR